MNRDTAIALGLLVLAGITWLAIVNWHAAIIVLLILILTRTQRHP